MGLRRALRKYLLYRRPSRLSHERVLILLSLPGAARQVTLSAADVVAVR